MTRSERLTMLYGILFVVVLIVAISYLASAR